MTSLGAVINVKTDLLFFFLLSPKGLLPKFNRLLLLVIHPTPRENFVQIRQQNLGVILPTDKVYVMLFLFSAVLERYISERYPYGPRGCKNTPAPFPGRMS